MQQFATMMQSAFPFPQEEQKYRIPGVSGPVNIDRKQFVHYQSHLHLYHKNSGKKIFDSTHRDQQEDYAIKILRKFLAGEEITEEAIYIDSEMRYRGHPGMFIPRRKIDDMKKSLRDAAEKCHKRSFEHFSNRTDKFIISFAHEPSAGGTTIGQVALWSLKDDYPCVEVRGSITEEVFDGISFLHDMSKLPVIVLCDQPYISKEYASSMSRDLNVQRNCPTLVFHVYRSVAIQPKRGSSDKVFPMVLDKDEDKALTALYQFAGCDVTLDRKSVETEPTPFLFGVLAFKKDYRKIEAVIQFLLKEADEKHQKLISTVVLISNLTNQPLHAGIAAQLLGLSIEQENAEQVKKQLKAARHLLAVKRLYGGGPGFWIVHRAVGAKILTEVFSGPGAEKDQLTALVDNLCSIADPGSNSQPILELVRELLAGHTTASHFSAFITGLRKCLTTEEIVHVFETLSNSFPERQGHILAHLARYIMYELNDIDLSLKYLRNALQVSAKASFVSTKCKDHVILGTAAHLLLCKVGQEHKAGSYSFQEMLSTANDGIALSQTAQQLGKRHGVYKAHSFMTEILMRHFILQRFFESSCEQKNDVYLKKVSEGECDGLVSDSHRQLLPLIFDLEKKQEDGLLDDNYKLKDNHMKKLDGAKYWLGYRYCQLLETGYIHIPKLPEEIDETYAWVLADILVLNRKKQNEQQRFWTEENQPSLPVSLSVDSLDDQFTSLGTIARIDLWDQTMAIEILNQEDLVKLETVLLNCEHRLSRNYFQLIVVQWQLLKKFGKKNRPADPLSSALKIADQWAAKFSDYRTAIFFQACFKLVRAIELAEQKEENKAELKDIHRHFSEIKKLSTVKSQRTNHGHSETERQYGTDKLRIFLGKGRNLRMLERLNSKTFQDQCAVTEKKERRFCGFVVDKKKIQFPDLACTIRAPTLVDERVIKEKKKCSFGVALSYTQMTAINERFD